MKRLFCLFVVVLVSTTAGVFLGLFMAAKFIDGQITVVKSTKMENVPSPTLSRSQSWQQ